MAKLINDELVPDDVIDKFEDFLYENDLPGLIELQGFMLAGMSGPNPLDADACIDFLGLKKLKVKSEEVRQDMMAMTIALYYGLEENLKKGELLLDYLDDYDDEDERVAVKKVFAQGYMQAAGSDIESWSATNDMMPMLTIMMVLAAANDDEAREKIFENKIDDEAFAELKNAGLQNLTNIVSVIYEFWEKQGRSSFHNDNDHDDDHDHRQFSGHDHVHHHEHHNGCCSAPPAKSTKIPRNDPCPCGSGKKYKKCCLQ